MVASTLTGERGRRVVPGGLPRRIGLGGGRVGRAARVGLGAGPASRSASALVSGAAIFWELRAEQPPAWRRKGFRRWVELIRGHLAPIASLDLLRRIVHPRGRVTGRPRRSGARPAGAAGRLAAPGGLRRPLARAARRRDARSLAVDLRLGVRSRLWSRVALGRGLRDGFPGLGGRLDAWALGVVFGRCLGLGRRRRLAGCLPAARASSPAAPSCAASAPASSGTAASPGGRPKGEPGSPGGGWLRERLHRYRPTAPRIRARITRRRAGLASRSPVSSGTGDGLGDGAATAVTTTSTSAIALPFVITGTPVVFAQV